MKKGIRVCVCEVLNDNNSKLQYIFVMYQH